MRTVIFSVLAGTLLSVLACGQGASVPHSKKSKYVIPPDLCLSKGGIGIINTDLYIVVRSLKNELILKDGKRWTGKGAGTVEVVIVFEDRVWSLPDLPNGFDLSKSVVISFQGDIIRFFEFDKKSGGYYEWHHP